MVESDGKTGPVSLEDSFNTVRRERDFWKAKAHELEQRLRVVETGHGVWGEVDDAATRAIAKTGIGWSGDSWAILIDSLAAEVYELRHDPARTRAVSIRRAPPK